MDSTMGESALLRTGEFLGIAHMRKRGMRSVRAQEKLSNWDRVHWIGNVAKTWKMMTF